MKLWMKKIGILALALAISACPANSKKDPKKPTTSEESAGGQTSSPLDQKPIDQQQNISQLETKYANCEEKMRVVVEKNSPAFKDIPAFKSEISQVLAAASGSDQKDFLNVREKNSHYLLYAKKSTFTNNNVKGTRLTKIGLNEKGSTNPLYFEIAADISSAKLQLSISQRYSSDDTRSTLESDV